MAGIYIHIPFCHSKCAYCDFYSMPAYSDVDGFIDAIITELSLRHDEIRQPINTIYLGGGTPSILPLDALSRLISNLPLSDVSEFTVEVNPEDVSVERVCAWHDMGINRVSMGIQSLDDAQLKLIGRRHTAAQAIDAVSAIRQGGINNVSLDLIYALPTQTVDSWQKSLDGVLALHPQHLSAYMLSYEPCTRLTAMLNTGKIKAVDEDDAVEMYQRLIETARSNGYEHYEISNFAKPGFRAQHNSSYWNGTPYLGIGPAAHGFDGKVRRVNPSNVKAYISSLKSGQVAYVVEKESRTDRFNDMLITRMRTAEGLDFAAVPVPRRRKLLCDVYAYIERGDVVLADNHLSIPEQSWLISDSILRELLQ